MSCANFSFSGAPPTMTLTPSRRPDSASCRMMDFISGIVVVSRAERASTSGRYSWTCFRNSLAGTLMPRSRISKPTPRSIVATMFLPISCKSPRTVPIRTLPPFRILSFDRNGSSVAVASFMARADSSTSGMNTSPLRNRSPMTSIAGSMPFCRMSPASTPDCSNSFTCCVIARWSPVSTSAWTFSNPCAKLKAVRAPRPRPRVRRPG